MVLYQHPKYGHYLGRKGATSNFDNTDKGLSHSGGTTIPAHGKEKGIRLAWSEGWGYYFAISSQVFSLAETFGYPMPAIPMAGDNVIDDTTGKYDMEKGSNSANGYASELSIASILYDLVDTNQDKSTKPGIYSVDVVSVSTKRKFLPENLINSL